MDDENIKDSENPAADSANSSSERPPAKDAAPEPPASYRPGQPAMPAAAERMGDSEFEAVRRTIGAAQIMALVSLFIGGVVLSSASLVVAIIGYRKLRNAASIQTSQEGWQALRRVGMLAIVMCVAAIAINVITLVMIYPVFMDAMQSGDYASLWNDSQAASESSSFWG